MYTWLRLTYEWVQAGDLYLYWAIQFKTKQSPKQTIHIPSLILQVLYSLKYQFTVIIYIEQSITSHDYVSQWMGDISVRVIYIQDTLINTRQVALWATVIGYCFPAIVGNYNTVDKVVSIRLTNIRTDLTI